MYVCSVKVTKQKKPITYFGYLVSKTWISFFVVAVHILFQYMTSSQRKLFLLYILFQYIINSSDKTILASHVMSHSSLQHVQHKISYQNSTFLLKQ